VQTGLSSVLLFQGLTSFRLSTSLSKSDARFKKAIVFRTANVICKILAAIIKLWSFAV